MTEKIRPDWISGSKGYQFRTLCPVCGITTVYQWSTSRNAYVCNREIPRVHTLTEDKLEKTWTETISALLGAKKDLPPDKPLSIDTIIISQRLHVPNAGRMSSLSSGTIETNSTLGYALMHLHDSRGMVGNTREERAFMVNHLEEIRSNEGIKAFLDKQKPWDGYSWAQVIELIERQKEVYTQNTKNTELTEARAKALEAYMPQSIQISPRASLDHSQTQEAAKKAGTGDLLLIPPKDREKSIGAGLGIPTAGGTTELQKAENEEHAKFSAESEKRTTEYYESLGISDLQLDCPHRASSKAPRVRDCLTGLRPQLVCLQCGQITPREKLLAQVKHP